jgi:O-acetylserine/cysteine efflux transporter
MPPAHIALAVVCALVWGFVFVVIRWGLDELPPLLFTALRFASAALAIPVLALLTSGGWRPPVAWHLIITIGLVLGVCQFGLLFLGMALGLPAGLASLVMQSQAFFTTLLSVILLAERPGAQRLTGMAVAFGGIALIATALPSGGSQLGLLCCLGGGLSWAVANILTRKARARNALQMMVWVSLIPPLPLAALSWFFEGPAAFAALTELSGTAVFAVLYNGYIANLLGFGLWTWLLTRNPATRVAPFSLLVPVFGMGFAWLLLGETLSPLKIAGCLAVLAGLCLTILTPKPPATPPVTNP